MPLGLQPLRPRRPSAPPALSSVSTRRWASEGYGCASSKWGRMAAVCCVLKGRGVYKFGGARSHTGSWARVRMRYMGPPPPIPQCLIGLKTSKQVGPLTELDASLMGCLVLFKHCQNIEVYFFSPSNREKTLSS